MKILVLCHKIPYPPIDGGTIASLNMIKGLQLVDNNLTVLTMRTPKHSGTIENIPDKLKKNIHWESVWVNTAINPFSLFYNLLFSSKPYNAKRFESNGFASALRILLQTEKYDLVQLEGLYLGSYLPLIRKYSQAKIVLRAHNVEADIWKQMSVNTKSRLSSWYYRVLSKRLNRFEKLVSLKVDAIVPLSEEDGSILNLDNKLPLHVCPIAVNQSMLIEEDLAANNDMQLGFLGALDWLPNQEGLKWFLSEIWPKVHTDNPQWILNIAGRGASEKFKQTVEKEELNFMGEVDDAQEFIDSQSIMVVPLLSGSGVRVKIIEAMARGKCVLTTGIGAAGIDVENKKHLYIANTIEEQVDTLNYLMANPNKIESCGSSARVFVAEHYMSNRISNDLMKFYSKLLS